MKVELNPWMVPNFVTAKMPPRPRQDGFAEGPKWALSEVDADMLAAQCDQFCAEVFRKAGKPDPANTTVHGRQPAAYNELLYAVGRKFPGETRHATALRYIREAESRESQSGACTQNASGQPRLAQESKP